MTITCDETLVMPSSYVLMDENEMTYLEGGGSVNTDVVAWAIDVGCALCGIYASACGEILGRGLIALIKTTWKSCSGKVATILGASVASGITVGIGKLNKVAGIMVSCLSFGGIIGLCLDSLDGKLDSTYRW